MKSGLRFSACDFSLQTSCWFQNSRLGQIASFARANALFEELPLHRVAGQRQRRTEVLARRVVPSAAQLKLAHGGSAGRSARWPEAAQGQLSEDMRQQAKPVGIWHGTTATRPARRRASGVGGKKLVDRLSTKAKVEGGKSVTSSAQPPPTS